jgi:hypothetical protein
MAEPGGSAAHTAAGLRCHRARGRPPGGLTHRRHGGLRREQGRRCRPDPHLGYRAPHARDPVNAVAPQLLDTPAKPGHLPSRGAYARGRAGGDRRRERLPGQRRRSPSERAILPAYGA